MESRERALIALLFRASCELTTFAVAGLESAARMEREIDDALLAHPLTPSGVREAIADRQASESKDRPTNNPRLAAAAPDLLSALEGLFRAYCDEMRDQYDYPNSDWTPERDDDEAALAARAAIRLAGGAA